MKYLFAAGGTAGHINPALSVANYIKKKQPDAQILFAGNPRGMEAKLVPQAGYDFVPVNVRGIKRQLTLENIGNNILAIGCVFKSSAQAKKILKSFQPDIVVGTGGYVSGPVLRKASQLGFKTVTHEQNAFPGVTTKLLSKYVDRVLLAVEEAKKYLEKGCEYEVVGNPIREEILFEDREKARRELGIGDRMCILSFGGSLGARTINEAVAGLIAWHYKTDRIHHIHATGRYGTELVPRLLKEKGVDLTGNKHVDIREYIDDMPRLLAAADLIISRSGAITLSELQAAGKASILIPSPNVAENHQYHNACVLSQHGAAVVIEEKELTQRKLCDIVEDFLNHPQKLKEFGENAQKLAIIDANDRIYQILMKLLGK
ncbi:undecaprenyldiphospho-muramoylpentapeptide beta-N-acetylglucosaminyltransferase [Candidatus Soleaferrea massiliensis]|uniref:undecaprenyldiphospho-muramoylpentapeptide beta-N-acetylglucosaminyltransferase n=1 Tax=Candidatus Soleaferrea massiliensis TaxID=1470354 RepID=UPI0005901EFC|nr:undecaprenyldiphospho-muramoylpentapeptide beta-N-acetylglucosaminyltransferase [Candidatus Soleaferrea massiliensis]